MPSDSKIAYILSKFPVLTETFIRREITELRKRGVDVEVFSLKNTNLVECSQKSAEELMNTTHYFPYFFSTKIWSALLFYFSTEPVACFKILTKILTTHIRNPVYLLKTLAVVPKGFAIAKELKEQEINKIHAHWATIPTTAAWMVAKLNGSSFTFTAHAWDIYQIDVMLEDKLQDAAKVITISEYNKRYLIQKYPKADPDKIRIIHCGVNLDIFIPHEVEEDDIFTILSVGRLTKKKGFDVLLRACDLLRDKKVPFKCKIVFVNGNYENEIFQLFQSLNLEGYVEFIPELQQDKLINCYTEADCFVLPCVVADDNDRDGIPVVILEALAMELPVVSTPISGIPEVIVEGETGLLVKSEDAHELAAAIQRLYNDPKLCETLGKAGRDIVKSEFDIPSNVKHLMESIL